MVTVGLLTPVTSRLTPRCLSRCRRRDLGSTKWNLTCYSFLRQRSQRLLEPPDRLRDLRNRHRADGEPEPPAVAAPAEGVEGHDRDARVGQQIAANVAI